MTPAALQAVFRVNFAPVRGFEQFVGRRTTYRVLGPAPAAYLAAHGLPPGGLLPHPSIRKRDSEVSGTRPPPFAARDSEAEAEAEVEAWVFWHYGLLRPDSADSADSAGSADSAEIGDPADSADSGSGESALERIRRRFPEASLAVMAPEVSALHSRRGTPGLTPRA